MKKKKKVSEIIHCTLSPRIPFIEPREREQDAEGVFLAVLLPRQFCRATETGSLSDLVSKTKYHL